jgi:hypothetical protein
MAECQNLREGFLTDFLVRIGSSVRDETRAVHVMSFLVSPES